MSINLVDILLFTICSFAFVLLEHIADAFAYSSLEFIDTKSSTTIPFIP